MTSVYPFQKIYVVSSEGSDEQILLAASGPYLSAISLRDGRILSHWPSQDDCDPPEQSPNGDGLANSNERPSKRRKVDATEGDAPERRSSDASDESVEIVAERKKGERRKPKKILDEKASKISHVLATRDGRYVVIVTSENKAITVLELDSAGQLRIVSERCLPKRLCAVKLTKHEETLLAADKFGDVYALPLHPSKDWVATAPIEASQTTFVPSASELTVHTKGNLAALRQQRERKDFKQRKEGPNFEYKVVLGHVSLLTDLEVAEGLVDDRSRPFILTADRDEHIRVSRGIPQAHIIENYCLGHQEFISKLCVVPWSPRTLVVGSGELYLKVYEWQSGRMLQELSLMGITKAAGAGSLVQDESEGNKLAVSGIWPIDISHDTTLRSSIQADGVLVVAFEGSPHLHTFVYKGTQTLEYVNTNMLGGNLLDVAQITATSRILVSWDNVHESGSVKNFRPTEGTGAEGLQALELKARPRTALDGDQNHELVWEEVQHNIDLHTLQECSSQLAITNPIAKTNDHEEAKKGKAKKEGNIYSTLGEFLYGLENLRKKRGWLNDDESIEIGSTGDT